MIVVAIHQQYSIPANTMSYGIDIGIGIILLRIIHCYTYKTLEHYHGVINMKLNKEGK